MLVKVEFSSFAIDPVRHLPLVVLKEVNGNRMLPIPVGPLEASAIAMKTLGVAAEKPLTIDVAKSILEELCGRLARVILEPESGGSLAARLDITSQGMQRRIDCRASDAIALALGCKAPVFVRETVFEAIGRQSGNPRDSDKLRAHLSSINTLEFGSYYLE